MLTKKLISLRLFQHALQPISQNEPVDFKTQITKATRAIITCPLGDYISCCGTIITNFINIFPTKTIVVLYSSNKKNHLETEKLKQVLDQPIIFPDIPKQNLWNLITSKSLKLLTPYRFDILLDLDTRFSLLGIYLCRLLNPPIKISFSKPLSSNYYNLQYKGKSDTPYPEKIIGLLSFLQQIIS